MKQKGIIPPFAVVTHGSGRKFVNSHRKAVKIEIDDKGNITVLSKDAPEGCVTEVLPDTTLNAEQKATT
jgi:hypothetical protein